MTPDEIRQKIERLEEQRIALIAQANQQIGLITGQIQVLRELLACLDGAAHPAQAPGDREGRRDRAEGGELA